MNKKGFVFIETIVVIAILSSLLIIIYGSFNIILNNEKKRLTYDQTSYLYRVKLFKDFLQKNNVNDALNEIDSDNIMELKCQNNIFISNDNDNTNLCNKYIETLNINKIYLSNRKLANNFNDSKVLDYMSKKNSDNKYLLIIKFNDGNIASLNLSYQTINNSLSEDDKKTITKSCIAAIQKEDPTFSSILSTGSPNNLLNYLGNNSYINCSNPTLKKPAVDKQYLTTGSFLFGEFAFVINENFLYYTKDFEASKNSNEKKGLIFRGVINNNYVKFNEKDELWRIFKINNDGSIKIVLDKSEETFSFDNEYINYLVSENINLINYNYKTEDEQNGIVQSINTWYENYFGSDFNDYLTVSNFCIDKVDVNMSEKKYNDLKETVNIIGCDEIFNNKVGLLTVNDINAAGASIFFKNDAFYLYNSDNKNSIITFSFYNSRASSGKISSFSYYIFGKDGSIGSSEIYYISPIEKTYTLRPVVTLKNNVEFTMGDTNKTYGTSTNPFIIGG